MYRLYLKYFTLSPLVQFAASLQYVTGRRQITVNTVREYTAE